MKNVRHLAVLAITLCFFCSCKKDQAYNGTIEPENRVEHSNRSEEFPKNDFEIIDGRIVLENEDALNDLIQELDMGIDAAFYSEDSEYAPNFEFLDKWEEGIGFQSHRSVFLSSLSSDQYEALEELPVPDDALSSLLNADGVIEVKPWIFKLDGGLEKVYAIGSEELDLLPDLINNPEGNSAIMDFSFEDDVFAILSGEIENLPLQICNAPWASKQEDSGDGWIDNNCSEGEDYRYFFRLKYRKIGITAKLYFKFKHRKDSFWSPGRKVSLDYIVDALWFPRCEDGIRSVDLTYDRCSGDPINFASMPHLANYNYQKKFYNKTKRLTGYYAYVGVRYTNRCVSPSCCSGCQPDYAVLDAGTRCISSNLSNPYCN